MTRRWTVRACSGHLATPQPGRFIMEELTPPDQNGPQI
ncbi:MAG: hypothetical protein OJF47_002865 [Nitrospira sp.]|nr:MAG: hypothetical protein OJF47_002865 [Nitrospira sp.]